MRSALAAGACVSLMLASTAWAAPSCDKRIAFVRDVIDRDLKTGFVGKGVHDQMAADLSHAEAACGTGRDAEAQSIISATQRKHGYPVR